jgi:site-specific DNA-methyltransferase (adenine-specific)
MPEQQNKLYYGDNLAVLRDYIPSNSVDLIYLDPPFNSRQDYNVLFAEKDGARSASQITAFKDTWEWNEEAARSYESVVEQGGRVAEAMRAFRTLLGGSDMLAYLAMMAHASWNSAASSKTPVPSTSTATPPPATTSRF